MSGADLPARGYRVHLVHTVSTTVEVEAATVEDAIDQALGLAPSPTNATNRGIDPGGEWYETAVYDADGVEVWSADAAERNA